MSKTPEILQRTDTGQASYPKQLIAGTHHSPFGPVTVAYTNHQLCALTLSSWNDSLAFLRQHWPNVSIKRDQKSTAPIVDQLLSSPDSLLKEFTLLVKGTDFQFNVWKALLDIPKSSQCSYQAIAQQINNPMAVRAVGTAIGSNPIAILIPCHRVVRSNGELGGYHWGLEIKQKLLDWEKNA